MAYTDQKMSGGKVTAIVIVVLIHVALGYAFITGLAYQYIKKTTEKLNTFDVAPPPPPPPDVPPPPPPPNQPNLPPPPTTVVSPPPIVPPTATFTMQTTPVIPPSQPVAPPAPPAPPNPPAPPVRVVSQAAVAKGNPGQYFGPDAYPPAAQRAEAQGRVVAKLTIGTDGRVTDCSVTSSSGNSDLDNTTCRIAKQKVRFSPAKDESGAAIASSYTLPVRWVLPRD